MKWTLVMIAIIIIVISLSLYRLYERVNYYRLDFRRAILKIYELEFEAGKGPYYPTMTNPKTGKWTYIYTYANKEAK